MLRTSEEFRNHRLLFNRILWLRDLELQEGRTQITKQTEKFHYKLASRERKLH